MVAMASPWKQSNGTYYFRVAIPKDLQGRFGKQIRKYSLKTKNAAEARRLFIVELEKFQREMELARTGFSLSPTQAKALAGEWLRSALEEDARRRDAGPLPEEEAASAIADEDYPDGPYETDFDAMEAADSVGDHLRAVREEFHAVAREHGLHLEPGTESQRSPARELFWAKVHWYAPVDG
jgi:hypothetical protein